MHREAGGEEVESPSSSWAGVGGGGRWDLEVPGGEAARV